MPSFIRFTNTPFINVIVYQVISDFIHVRQVQLAQFGTALLISCILFQRMGPCLQSKRHDFIKDAHFYHQLWYF